MRHTFIHAGNRSDESAELPLDFCTFVDQLREELQKKYQGIEETSTGHACDEGGSHQGYLYQHDGRFASVSIDVTSGPEVPESLYSDEAVAMTIKALQEAFSDRMAHTNEPRLTEYWVLDTETGKNQKFREWRAEKFGI